MDDSSAPSQRSPGRIVRGALPDDLTKAVDIISAAHHISGSTAYDAISRAARRSRLSVRQTAQLIVSVGQGSSPVRAEDLAHVGDRATA